MGARMNEVRMTAGALLGVSTAGFAAVLCAVTPVRAADLPPPAPVTATWDVDGTMYHKADAGDHGAIPAGVQGASMVGAGKFMLNYIPMYMHMEGNYSGTSQVSQQTILNTQAPSGNSYRIIPNSMDVQSHMFAGMYGVTDWLNLMVMSSYQIKSMNMTTFSMGMSPALLGASSGTTEGFGDTSVGLLWRLYQDPVNHVHFNMGFSLPTGSTTETVTMLTPMMGGTFMNMRANYGMQLGTGTVDVMPGLTYTGHLNSWSWGAQWRSRVALDDNDEGYRWGNLHEFTGWGGYTWIPGVTTTVRALGSIQDPIHGSDPAMGMMMNGVNMIMMPGANPALYGGRRVDLLGGIEIAGARFGLPGVNLAIEGGGPVYQDLNGPQLGESWRLTGALRVAF
jgi:hypothetical protein